MDTLRWVEKINEHRGGKPYLPFKLHQFVAQSGAVYVTLEDRESRLITLDAGYSVVHEGAEKLIFPLAFSRITGHDFICVTRDDTDSKLLPREFRSLPRVDDEEEDGRSGAGYIVMDTDDETLWSDARDLDGLPEVVAKS